MQLNRYDLIPERAKGLTLKYVNISLNRVIHFFVHYKQPIELDAQHELNLHSQLAAHQGVKFSGVGATVSRK